MKIVILAEKNSMAKDLIYALTDKYTTHKGYYSGTCAAKPYEGSELIVTYAAGHLYELYAAKDYDEIYEKWNLDLFPFIPDRFKYKPISSKKEQIKVINQLFKEADLIINSCDAGREGELIFSIIYEYSRTKTDYKRLWLQSFTKPSIWKAFANMKSSSEMQALDRAARLRAQSDWKVGCNCTVFTTRKFGGGELMTVGRVQTPALGILVKREYEIENFVSKPYWQIQGSFNSDLSGVNEDTSFDALLHTTGYLDIETKKTGALSFLDEEKCDNIISKLTANTGIIEKLTKTSSKINLPPLFNTISLSAEATKKYGYTAGDVSAALQSLYEKKLTSYPRTGAKWLPDDMMKPMVKVLDLLAKNSKYNKYLAGITYQPFTSQHFNSKKIEETEEDHYALIPTGKQPEEGSLSKIEENIYDLIVKSVIRIAYPPATIEKVDVIVNSNNSTFKCSGKTIIDKGWLAVDCSPNFKSLPALTEGQTVSASFTKVDKKTSPPSRYNDATFAEAINGADKTITDKKLAEAIKGKGIGRPSTTAELIESLVKKGYVERKGTKKVKFFYITDKARTLFEHLNIDDIKSVEMTAHWETELKNIENGKGDADEFDLKMSRVTQDWCEQLRKCETLGRSSSSSSKILSTKCPVCGGDVILGKYGYICKNAFGKDKSCYFSINTSYFNINKTNAEKLISTGKTNLLTLTKKDKSGTYKARLVWDNETEKPFQRVKISFD